MIRWIGIAIIAFLPISGYGATFTDDEFSGDLGAWTTGGDGTITTVGGFLSITSSNTTYDYIEQANITGPFDIVARLKDSFYPSEIDNANYQCALYVRVDDTNFVAGYQNRNNAEGQNEIMLQMYYGNVPTVFNPACDPMEYVCIRAKRDATNTFYIYKNSATDCTGDWTEVGETEYRLVSDAAVSVIVRAKAPEASTTYLVDYVIVNTEPGYACEGDFEADGDVDGKDLATLIDTPIVEVRKFAESFGKTRCF